MKKFAIFGELERKIFKSVFFFPVNNLRVFFFSRASQVCNFNFVQKSIFQAFFGAKFFSAGENAVFFHS